MSDRSITLADFLTDKQVRQAYEIYKKHQKNPGSASDAIRKEVIEPNMKAINRKLGQENDSYYLSYACEYVFSQMRNKP